MPSLEFAQSGKTFPMHCKMLREFAKNFPRGAKYAPLALDIVALGIDSVSSLIICNSILDTDAYDQIWRAGSPRLRRELLNKAEFVASLSHEQADDLKAMQDVIAFANLASHGEALFGPEADRRLAREDALQLLEFARDLGEMRIRRALARNIRLPDRFCPSLAEQILYEIPPRDLRFSNMTSADAAILDSLDSDQMLSLVKNMASIREREARKSAISFFVHNPDPGVRLLFAEHAGRYAKWTPDMRQGLAELGEDPDPDVAYAAKHSGESRWR